MFLLARALFSAARLFILLIFRFWVTSLDSCLDSAHAVYFLLHTLYFDMLSSIQMFSDGAFKPRLCISEKVMDDHQNMLPIQQALENHVDCYLSSSIFCLRWVFHCVFLLITNFRSNNHVSCWSSKQWILRCSRKQRLFWLQSSRCKSHCYHHHESSGWHFWILGIQIVSRLCLSWSIWQQF